MHGKPLKISRKKKNELENKKINLLQNRNPQRNRLRRVR
eukprot:09634.XXX_437595_437711_1 [CDS] Oithona nana genome sequencing.